MLKKVVISIGILVLLFFGIRALIVSLQIVPDSVPDLKSITIPNVDQQANTTDFSRALDNLKLHKMQVSAFYSSYRRLPESNKELGIPPPEAFRTTHVKQRIIGPQGQVGIEFNEHVGENAKLVFIPTINVTKVGRELLWRCFITGLEVTPTLESAVGGTCDTLPSDMSTSNVAELSKPEASVDTLILAINSRRMNVVTELIQQGINLNSTNANGQSPLSAAITIGNSHIVKLLVEAGSDVNQRLKPNNKTLLMHAIESNRSRGKNILHTLLSAGLNVETRDNRGKTALMYAAINNDRYAAQTLLDVGANIKAQDLEGKKALDYALFHGRRSSVYRLLYEIEHRPVELFIKLPGE